MTATNCAVARLRQSVCRRGGAMARMPALAGLRGRSWRARRLWPARRCRAGAGGLRRRRRDAINSPTHHTACRSLRSSRLRLSRLRRDGASPCRADPAAVGAAAMPGIAAQSMKNAAEMALAEFKQPERPAAGEGRRRQSGGAQQAAQQALAEGAEIIVGPLFAHSVGVVGAAARAARRAGDRVLDRRQRRRARRLSA